MWGGVGEGGRGGERGMKRAHLRTDRWSLGDGGGERGRGGKRGREMMGEMLGVCYRKERRKLMTCLGGLFLLAVWYVASDLWGGG